MRKGSKHTNKTKQKISESSRDRIPWNKGKTSLQIPSQETRRKLSESLKKYYETHKHQCKGQLPWNKGIPRLERTKQKLRDSHNKYYETHDSPMKGQHHSEKTKQKMSDTIKHKWQDPEYRKKMHKKNHFFNRSRIRPTNLELFTEAEMLLLGIYHYLPEFHIINKNGKSFFPDFMIIPNLVIECDGHHWHSLPSAKESDAIRQKDLNSLGWRVIRFTETQIHNELKLVGEKIMEVVV